MCSEGKLSTFSAGASSLGGGSPRQPSPLPLSLVSPEFTAVPLLRLEACPEDDSGSLGSSPAVGALAEQLEQADGVVLRFKQRWVQQQQQPQLAQCSGRRPSLEQHRSCLEGEHEWGLVIASLALQIHMQGWQDTLACLQSFLAPANEVARILSAASSPPAHAAALHRTAAAPPASLGAAPATTPQQQAPGRPPPPHSGAQPAQQAGPALGLRIELQRLVVAVVADAAAPPRQPGSIAEEENEGLEVEGEAGEEALIPACALTTALTVSCCVDAGGGLLLGVEVPMALVGMGVVPRHAVPAVVALPLDDSLLGLHQAEFSVVVQPRFTVPGGRARLLTASFFPSEVLAMMCTAARDCLGGKACWLMHVMLSYQHQFGMTIISVYSRNGLPDFCMSNLVIQRWFL
jgi:hypothetical protein